MSDAAGGELAASPQLWEAVIAAARRVRLARMPGTLLPGNALLAFLEALDELDRAVDALTGSRRAPEVLSDADLSWQVLDARVVRLVAGLFDRAEGARRRADAAEEQVSRARHSLARWRELRPEDPLLVELSDILDPSTQTPERGPRRSGGGERST